MSVVVTSVQDTPVFNEYVGQTFARDMVEVRGRVDGYIEKRFFETGSDVQAGQPLYILDLRPYEADVQKVNGELPQSKANQDFAARQVGLLQAEADLGQAQANLLKARRTSTDWIRWWRRRPRRIRISTTRNAALSASEANVRARQASVEQARFSTKAQIETTEGQVESQKARPDLPNSIWNTPPSARRSAAALATVSFRSEDLLRAASPQPLTTIVPLDVIWVRFKLSEEEYFEYKRGTRRPRIQNPTAAGSGRRTRLSHDGRHQNTVNQVDPRTGTIELQATFPNPEKVLLPGQFGRVRLKTEDRRNVVLVPQRAVQELQGPQSVLIVGPDNKVRVSPS